MLIFVATNTGTIYLHIYSFNFQANKMNYILFDPKDIRIRLLPLTYFRPVSEIRCGILSLKEKWEYYLNQPVSYLTEAYLQEKYPSFYKEENIYIDASIFPDKNLIEQIKNLKKNDLLLSPEKEIIAFYTKILKYDEINRVGGKEIIYSEKIDRIKHHFDIFNKNAVQIEKDFELVTQNKVSQPLSQTNTVIGKGKIFIEKDARIEACVFNTEQGNIYIGKGVNILEGSLIRGPFAALDQSVVKMGSKIYGGTTLGPKTKAGGEIKNVVFLGNSNKGHDGYLGDSVIAEWCNLGAGTNNSNLKNNYSNVKLFDYYTQDYINTGLQFCGMIMGDHSKCSIATMFNTGTVVGVNANIFGNGFQPKFFPSFKWGGQKYVNYRFEKAIEVAKTVMKRRGIEFNQIEKKLFENVYNLTQKIENQ